MLIAISQSDVRIDLTKYLTNHHLWFRGWGMVMVKFDWRVFFLTVNADPRTYFSLKKSWSSFTKYRVSFMSNHSIMHDPHWSLYLFFGVSKYQLHTKIDRKNKPRVSQGKCWMVARQPLKKVWRLCIMWFSSWPERCRRRLKDTDVKQH